MFSHIGRRTLGVNFLYFFVQYIEERPTPCKRKGEVRKILSAVAQW